MAHSYGSQHIDKFRCDCAKCVPMSAAERKERQGEPAQPRRTSRATSSVDAKVVEKLFDRTTLPDECFKNVVSYMGSLEPRRPWRRYGRADFVKPAGEPLT